MWSMLRLDIFQSFPAGGKHEMEQKPDLKRPVGSFRSIHPLKGGNIVFFGGKLQDHLSHGSIVQDCSQS